MWRPVIAKKLAPKSGGAEGHFSAISCARRKGRRPSSMRCFHSKRWRMRKARPPTIVAPIQRRADFKWLCAEARTAITIVKLDARRQSVIVVEKRIEGENGNGVGHDSLDARA